MTGKVNIIFGNLRVNQEVHTVQMVSSQAKPNPIYI